MESTITLEPYRGYEFGAGTFDEPRRGILRLTLTRPEKWNPLPQEMHDALPELFSGIAADKTVNAFVLRGSGDIFSSGGDVKGGMQNRHAGEVVEMHRIAVRIMTRLLEIPQLTLCIVNGPAIGFAANLALHFDFLVASENAYFQETHAAFGTVPGDGAMSIWPQLLGPARAREYLLGGARLEAAEALRLGFVNRVAPPEEVDEVAMELLEGVMSMAPLAVRLGKMVINTPLRAAAEQSLNLSMAAEMATMLSEDFKHSVDTFAATGRWGRDWKGR